MRFLAAIACFVLASCSQAQWNEKLSTPIDREMGLKAISALRSGQIGSVKDSFEPAVFAQTAAVENKVRGLFPTVGSPALVTVNSYSLSNGRMTQTTTALNYEMGSRNSWAIVQILLRSDGREERIIGWHATPTDRQPTAIGNFTFAKKSVIHYTWLLAMMASTATIITALALLWKAKGIPRRWLWVVGSLAGIGQFTLNWASGAWGINPVAFSILGSSAVRPSPFDPWMLTFSLPIVAILFLIRRSDLLAKLEQPSG